MTVYIQKFVAQRTTTGTTAGYVNLYRWPLEGVGGVAGAAGDQLTAEFSVSWSRPTTGSLIGISKYFGIWRFSAADTLDTNAAYDGILIPIVAIGTNGTNPPNVSTDISSNQPRVNLIPHASTPSGEETLWVVKGSIWIGS